MSQGMQGLLCVESALGLIVLSTAIAFLFIFFAGPLPSNSPPGSIQARNNEPKSNLPPVNPPPVNLTDWAKPEQGPWKYLADLKEFDVKTGRWPSTQNGTLGSPDGTRILFGGTPSPKGLSIHPIKSSYSTAKYRLDKKGVFFKSAVALNGKSFNFSDPIFEVLSDSKSLWKSNPIRVN